MNNAEKKAAAEAAEIEAANAVDTDGTRLCDGTIHEGAITPLIGVVTVGALRALLNGCAAGNTLVFAADEGDFSATVTMLNATKKQVDFGDDDDES